MVGIRKGHPDASKLDSNGADSTGDTLGEQPCPRLFQALPD
jgi:hypothetical protein